MMKGQPIYEPLDVRFWRKVNKTDTCWVWVGGTNEHGYGTIHLGGPRINPITGKRLGLQKAHRVSWEMANGPIPDGLCVLHKCDNPPCVRPDHLFLGTKADNQADAAAKGRMARGDRHHWRKLTSEDVRQIIADLVAGQTQNEIANRYGVSVGAIGHIYHGRSWKRVWAEVYRSGL